MMFRIYKYMVNLPIAQVDNAAHQVECHLRAKMIVAHMDRLAPYLGTARDEQP
jgi:hypothetical protein